MTRLSVGRPQGAGFITARATHHSVTKRLWCPTHGSMQDAQKVTPRSTEYELACGCRRSLMSSEAVDDATSRSRKERHDEEHDCPRDSSDVYAVPG